MGADIGGADWLTRATTQTVLAALDAADPGGSRFVGGCVRNTLLKEPVSDIDIATRLVPEETIRALENELQGLRKQLDDPSLSDKRKQELFKGFQMKTQEGVALDRERREFLQRRNTALNEKMVQKMRGILEEIRKLVEQGAKADDYDYVFDKSGLSTSQVPFLLYTKDATDITAGLLGVLNKDAPAPAPAPAPSGGK